MRLHRLRIPLTSPFQTASGVVTDRDVLLVEAFGKDESGIAVTGWGEAAPFPGQDEPMEVLLSEAAAGRLTATLAAAVDQAESDVAARAAGEPLAGTPISTVPISIAIGLGDPIARAEEAARRGARRFKLKVAPGATDHVAAIRAALPEALIGLDANRSFTDSELGQLWSLAMHDIAYIEEPFVTWDDRGAGRLAEAGIPLFADESASRLDDVSRLLLTDLVDGVTIKPGRLGWTGALKAVETARSLGKRWRVSGLLETGIGRSFTNLLAAQEDAFPSDVAPASWFLEAGVVDEHTTDSGITVGGAPGTGVEPDRGVLDRYRIAEYEVGL